MSLPALDKAKSDALRSGVVIPAHPLALTAERRLDERRQRALSRYYLASGAGGLAVAVHTTQFAIREPRIGLLRPVLELAAEVALDPSRPGAAGAAGTSVLVAGVVGRTEQALAEASMARDLGYDAVLLQLGCLRRRLGRRARGALRASGGGPAAVRLLPAAGVGGRRLGRDFWRRFAAIPNVVAIKVAPFDRYATLDVLLGVADSGRAQEIALYTGNDDAIIADLLFRLETSDATGRPLSLRFTGGLLGHWAVWTSRAVETLGRVHDALGAGGSVPRDLLELGLAHDRCQRRDLRPGTSLRRLHPGHPRDPAPPGPAGWTLDARRG